MSDDAETILDHLSWTPSAEPKSADPFAALAALVAERDQARADADEQAEALAAAASSRWMARAHAAESELRVVQQARQDLEARLRRALEAIGLALCEGRVESAAGDAVPQAVWERLYDDHLLQLGSDQTGEAWTSTTRRGVDHLVAVIAELSALAAVSASDTPAEREAGGNDLGGEQSSPVARVSET